MSVMWNMLVLCRAYWSWVSLGRSHFGSSVSNIVAPTVDYITGFRFWVHRWLATTSSRKKTNKGSSDIWGHFLSKDYTLVSTDFFRIFHYRPDSIFTQRKVMRKTLYINQTITSKLLFSFGTFNSFMAGLRRNGVYKVCCSAPKTSLNQFS